MNAVVRDGRATIATYSAGGCDEQWLASRDSRAVRMSDARAVKAAAAAGVNVFVSSGDNGAFACSRFDLKDWRPTGGNPSDFPYTVSVGGTYLERGPDGKYVDEAAWEWPLTNSGTGGGLNPLDARPVWQQGPGVDNQYSNGKRQFPDISAPADPYTGWYIVVGGEGSTAGGTSASSPFWAGLAALYEQMAKEAGLDRPRLPQSHAVRGRGVEPAGHGVPRHRPRREPVLRGHAGLGLRDRPRHADRDRPR